MCSAIKKGAKSYRCLLCKLSFRLERHTYVRDLFFYCYCDTAGIEPGGDFLLGTVEGKLTYRTWTRVSETLRRVKEFIHESQTVVFGL